MDLIDIFRAFYPKATEYTVFSRAHGIFSRIDHMLGHKTHLDTFKKIEIISSIFFDHTGMKLEINYKKKTEKQTKIWRLNNMLLNINGLAMRSRKKSKVPLRQKKVNHKTQNLWVTVKAVLRGKVIAL